MYQEFHAEQQPLVAYDPNAVGSVTQPFQYNISGRPAFACANIELAPGQEILAESGAMNWMDSELDVDTLCPGGCGTSCMRTCSGESFCMNKFAAKNGPGRITFGFKEPGDMLPFYVEPGQGWVLTREAFVCGSPDLHISAQFSGCAACCLSGEGIFMTTVSAVDKPGFMFCGGYGEIIRHDIPEGKVFFVDTGLFFAARKETTINVGCLGGIKTCLCSGEGLVMKFFGPITIFTQSRDPAIFRAFQAPTGGGGGGGDGAGGGGGGGGGA